MFAKGGHDREISPWLSPGGTGVGMLKTEFAGGPLWFRRFFFQGGTAAEGAGRRRRARSGEAESGIIFAARGGRPGDRGIFRFGWFAAICCSTYRRIDAIVIFREPASR